MSCFDFTWSMIWIEFYFGIWLSLKTGFLIVGREFFLSHAIFISPSLQGTFFFSAEPQPEPQPNLSSGCKSVVSLFLPNPCKLFFLGFPVT